VALFRELQGSQRLPERFVRSRREAAASLRARHRSGTEGLRVQCPTSIFSRS